MTDYPPPNSCGIDLPKRTDPEPAHSIENVNWPHRSKEHDRAVRWMLATPVQRKVLREVEMVMRIMVDALRGGPDGK